MSISEKLTTIAENEQKVYNAGYEKGKQEGGNTEEEYNQGRQDENKAFWDVITDFGTKNDFKYGFYYWNCEYIRPPYKLTITHANSGMYTFARASSLKKVEKEYFDFSKKQKESNTNAGWNNTFNNCSNLEEIEDIGLNAQYSYSGTFRGCNKLHTIEKIGIGENTTWDQYVFMGCVNLVNLTIVGTIGKNKFNVSECTKLSKASLLSILNACNKQDLTETVTITLPSYCIDGETDTEMLMSETGDNDLYNAAMLARSYGYSVAFA